MSSAQENAVRSRPPVTETSDRDLLAAHAHGERHAFAELLRRHRDHLWQTALRASYSPEDADDCLQEAMLSAHRGARNFRGDSEVSSWLHRIVLNACVDRIRRNKLRRTEPLLDDSPYEPAYPRDDFAALDATLLLDDALFRLPAEQRTVLVLVELENYSVADTAALLGIPEGTVKSRCARGRRRLVEHLGSENS
ncbi:RNA polymerase sigma factor SigM [Nocardia yamanashiensis]|uniref:RNA polymerase sigma factor SigM n=1 Tax=Nocardia yamanashiensis TaxID=209247 RepID=UPI000A029569|nr:RNA polymerase sigma factor SigM [Nocardia yamanashiensis]